MTQEQEQGLDLNIISTGSDINTLIVKVESPSDNSLPAGSYSVNLIAIFTGGSKSCSVDLEIE